MAAALTAIAREPPPSADAAAARLLADLRAGVELYHTHLRERMDFARRALRVERLITRVRQSAPVRLALALRRYRLVQIAARPLRPLTRRVRELLS